MLGKFGQCTVQRIEVILMTTYRVKFFNNLINSNGREFKCLQRSLIIPKAADQAEALEIAKREFERAECIANWHCRAHLAKVESVSMIRNATESQMKQ
jgi:hypothetical protein